MGSEMIVGERNWETVDCRRVYSGEQPGDCCLLNVTGGFKLKGVIVL